MRLVNFHGQGAWIIWEGEPDNLPMEVVSSYGISDEQHAFLIKGEAVPVPDEYGDMDTEELAFVSDDYEIVFN